MGTKPQNFEFASQVPVSVTEAFAWHQRPGAFERLTPPWESVQLIERTGSIQDGDRVVLRISMGPFTRNWTAVHQGFELNRLFCDVQAHGPFAHWKHKHLFESLGSSQCRLTDQVEYVLPMGLIGNVLMNGWVRRKLDRMFAYRHRILAGDLLAHRKSGVSPMTVLISGSTGLIGRSLCAYLSAAGHEVTCLVRHPSASKPMQFKQVVWSPSQGQLEPKALEGFDAVIHLGGEGIAAQRWSQQQKQRIVDSRVKPTQLLSRVLAGLGQPPRVFICASATGYYGDRGEEIMDESSSPGQGFLPQTCQAWEEASEQARLAGIRVVHARFGLVLSPQGGALAKMLTPFSLALGGRLGSGGQYWSWISLDDVLDALLAILADPRLSGPVNLVSPQPLTNLQFTRILGQVLQRPTLLTTPAWSLRMAMGEMAESLLLSSQRVKPAKLLETGFQFRYPTLEAALSHMLGRSMKMNR